MGLPIGESLMVDPDSSREARDTVIAALHLAIHAATIPMDFGFDEDEGSLNWEEKHDLVLEQRHPAVSRYLNAIHAIDTARPQRRPESRMGSRHGKHRRPERVPSPAFSTHPGTGNRRDGMPEKRNEPFARTNGACEHRPRPAGQGVPGAENWEVHSCHDEMTVSLSHGRHTAA